MTYRIFLSLNPDCFKFHVSDTNGYWFLDNWFANRPAIRKRRELCVPTDISQYRLRFGFSLLYKTVFHLNSLIAQLSYEGRAAVEGALNSISKVHHHNINGGAVDDT
jgi:hypothetical protein